MTYEVRLSKPAERALLDLPPRDARRLAATLEMLGREPQQPGTIRLAAAPVAEYRHRVGEYGILFDIDDERGVVRVFDIRRRSEGA